MEIKTAHNLPEFIRLKGQWDELINGSRAGLFLHSCCLIPWFNHHPTGRLAVFLVYDNSRLIAGLPMVSGAPLTSGPRHRDLKVCRVAGAIPQDWVNDFTLPVRDGYSIEDVCALLLSEILSWSKGDDLLVWDVIDQKDPVLLLLVKLLKGFLFKGRVKYYKRYPFLKLNSDWEATTSHISKKFKKHMNYSIRRLERESDKFEFSDRDVQNPDVCMNQLAELHRMRWQDKSGKETDFLSEKNQAYHKELARNLAEKNWLRMYEIKIDGKSAAILYGMVYKEKFYFIQHGIDPAWDKFSVGSLLIKYSIERSLREGLSVFDFMKGRQTYKLRFSNKIRTNQSLEYSLTLKGFFYLLSERKTALKIKIRDFLFPK